MLQRFYTYLHCRPDGVPFYVGKGQGSRSHVFDVGRNRYHKNIVSKHGAENIRVFVFDCESEEEAFADEMQWIAQLRADGLTLANQTNGGDGPAGRIASAETRTLISAAQIGRKRSAECIAKRSATVRGSKRSDETRARMSAARKGIVFSLEHRSRIAAAARNISAETRMKLSLAKLGTSLSPETRAKMALAQQQRRRME